MLDASTEDQPSQQFASVGSGRRSVQAKSDVVHGVSGSGESPTAVSRLLNGNLTFTHHLYHHYDVEPNVHRRRDRTTGTTHGTTTCILTS